MKHWWNLLTKGCASLGRASLSLWPTHASIEEQAQERLDQIHARLTARHRVLGLPPPRRLRLHAPSENAVAEAWREVGRHMYAAMDQIDRELTDAQRRRLHPRE